MPRKAERAFKKGARTHHLKPGTERYNAYVYGGMKKRGLLDKPRRLSALKRSTLASETRRLVGKKRR